MPWALWYQIVVLIFYRVKLYLVISYGRFIENLARLWGIWVIISVFTYDKQLLILPNPACVFFLFFLDNISCRRIAEVTLSDTFEHWNGKSSFISSREWLCA